MNEALSSIRRTRRKKRRKVARRPRWVWPSLALAALAALAGTGLAARAIVVSSPVRVNRIEVSGTLRLTAERVRRAISDAEGEPILALDLDLLRRRVEEVAGVETAQVSRHLPDLLEVRVVERTPVARTTIGGAPAMLDGSGAVFPAGLPQEGDDRLPLVTGLETTLGASRLGPDDAAALRALAALRRVAPAVIAVTPATFDLSEQDRIVLLLDDSASELWLDRIQPERNLEQFFAWRGRVSDLAAGRPIDLRFPQRLTLVPLEPPPVAPDAPAEETGNELTPAPLARRAALTEMR